MRYAVCAISLVLCIVPLPYYKYYLFISLYLPSYVMAYFYHDSPLFFYTLKFGNMANKIWIWWCVIQWKGSENESKSKYSKINANIRSKQWCAFVCYVYIKHSDSIRKDFHAIQSKISFIHQNSMEFVLHSVFRLSFEKIKDANIPVKDVHWAHRYQVFAINI